MRTAFFIMCFYLFTIATTLMREFENEINFWGGFITGFVMLAVAGWALLKDWAKKEKE